MNGENYKGVIWPIRMQADGNLVTGNRRETIKCDFKLTILTRRFVNRDNGGERPMEPDFGTIFSQALLRVFHAHLWVPIARGEIISAFQVFERERLVRLQEVLASIPQDGALRLSIRYLDLLENFVDNYNYDLPPGGSSEIRTRG